MAKPSGPGRTERSSHWDEVYREKPEGSVSWYEPDPATSLELLAEAGLRRGARVLDVGSGRSTLVDRLLELGFRPGALDVSEEALAAVRRRLGPRADRVEWIHEDVTAFRAEAPWDAWHDRAVLHFLVDEGDRQAYVGALHHALAAGGVAVIATFGPDGPERCSGLPVRRYGLDELRALLGARFLPERSEPTWHVTPSGVRQQFLFARFRRV